MENNITTEPTVGVVPIASTIPEIPPVEATSTEIPPAENTVKPVSLLRETVIFLRDICIILIVVLTIRAYLVAPFRISGSSMLSNYFDGEFILVDKLNVNAFGMNFWEHHRGDVVVIEPHADNGRQFYIKRIIGLPGEKLKIEDWKVFIQKAGSTQFIQLNETYLDVENFWKTPLALGMASKENTFEIPEWKYFIMGDNRNHSMDARDCFSSCSHSGSSHFINEKDIVGKVWVTLGAVKIFDEFSIGRRDYEGNPQWLRIKLAEDMGYTTRPRFLNTARNWTYPELQ